jgi:hypothetical protein
LLLTPVVRRFEFSINLQGAVQYWSAVKAHFFKDTQANGYFFERLQVTHSGSFHWQAIASFKFNDQTQWIRSDVVPVQVCVGIW